MAPKKVAAVIKLQIPAGIQVIITMRGVMSWPGGG
jgi:hypothetical protein